MLASRKSQRYLIAFLTAASLWVVWLPLTRTLTGGGTYQWGVDMFNTMYRGAGLEGDYLFLVLQLVIGLTLIYMGFRNPRAPYPALLVMWHGLNLANDLFRPLVLGERNIFYGDTGRVAYDWTIVSPMLTGLMFVLALAWAVRETLSPEKFEQPQGWARRNVIFLAVFLAYLALVTFLERTGEAHGLTDMFVVPLNILAPMVIALCIMPWQTTQDSTGLPSN